MVDTDSRVEVVWRNLDGQSKYKYETAQHFALQARGKNEKGPFIKLLLKIKDKKRVDSGHHLANGPLSIINDTRGAAPVVLAYSAR